MTEKKLVTLLSQANNSLRKTSTELSKQMEKLKPFFRCGELKCCTNFKPK